MKRLCSNAVLLDEVECDFLEDLARKQNVGKRSYQERSIKFANMGWVNHYVGLLGESMVAYLTGGKIDREIYVSRDGGTDILGLPKTVEVKTSLSRWTDLYVNAKHRSTPDVYVLVHQGEVPIRVDRKDMRSTVRTMVAYGWVPGKEFREESEYVGSPPPAWKLHKSKLRLFCDLMPYLYPVYGS